MKAFNSAGFCADIIKARGNRSQQQIAESIGINRSTLSLLETGKQLPMLDVFTKICDFYSLKADSYFSESQENTPDVFMMGKLCKEDEDKLKLMLERIRVREKYERLSR